MMRPDHVSLRGVCSALLLLLCLTSSDGSPPSTLVQVNMLYRHGDRSPIYVYPKDKNRPDIWPEGLGWLTNIGKEQQYLLGQYLRQRYDGFINVTHYDHTEITIQSSAVQRCLMSAYSNLAGLFTPQGDQVWKEGLAWQPIPVTTPALVEDYKLAMKNTLCPRQLQILEEVNTSEKSLKYQAKHKEFLEMMSQNTGYPSTLDYCWTVWDCLTCERAHNVTLNDWAQKDGVYEQLTDAHIFLWSLWTATPELDKLRGGPLLREMIQNMQAVEANQTDFFKMHMYSAHDSTVGALLSSMKVFDRRPPTYAALVLVELHYIDNDYVVKIFYRNETTSDPFYLVPKGCEDPCKLSTFQTVLKDTISTDREAECKAQALSSESCLRRASLTTLALINVLAVALIHTTSSTKGVKYF